MDFNAEALRLPTRKWKQQCVTSSPGNLFMLAELTGFLASNLVLNFDMNGTYIHKINTGMAQQMLFSEEAFARIFYDVENFGVPVYHHMVHAIVAFTKRDEVAYAWHVASITAQMRLVLGSYMDNMHDKMIARSV
jgi:hypothetical protein